MVVSLHSLSTERGHGERGCRKRAIIETDEREEIACVGLPEMPASRTRDESKVEKAILTMKSLILAQDER